jgi:P-type Ca2+ transporter type 2C
MQIQDILWYNLSTKEALTQLQTEETGLNKAKVQARRSLYGLNELPTDKRLSWLRILFRQFNNVLIGVLLVAAFFSLLLQEWLDLSIILAAVLINTIVGFIQENKAEKSLEKLRHVVVLETKVIRDGLVQKINARNLVVGDIITLEAGDQVPADARIINQTGLQTSEAVLTGESTAVAKNDSRLNSDVSKKVLVSDQKNMLFKGTMIAEGVVKAVVVATGIKTELGKIAHMLKTTKSEQTPLQKRLAVFSRKLGLLVLIAALVIMAIGLIQGKDFWEIFLVSIAVAVSAIPEGLLVAITVILIIGMQRILKKKALVRKLVAAETLGSTSVVCVDKTGTLTEGKMFAAKLATVNAQVDLTKTKKLKEKLSPDLEKLLQYTNLVNNAVIENPADSEEDWRLVGSSTEKAVLLAGLRFGLDTNKLKQDFPRLDEVPFDSFSKMMITTHRIDNQDVEIRKGAPERILQICNQYETEKGPESLTDEVNEQIEKSFAKFSSAGYRLLAACYQSGRVKDGKNIFLGFFVIKDPLRPSVKQTIKLAKQAGLRTIMITGDHRRTARAIAGEIGLSVKDKNIITGEELDKLSDEEFVKQLKDIKVYARVTPAHKLKIVAAWQRHGEVVAMTGDGVNDAPALKAADIGIAVGSATDVTKETADMVLIDCDFSVIIEAIRQGRIIFHNIKKVIVYLLADAFSEVVLVLGSLLMGLPLPVTAAQILWINLVTDGFPAAALTVEKSHDNVMQEKPRPKKAPILDKEMKALIFIIGVVIDLILLSLFFYLNKLDLFEIGYIRTIIFTALGLDSLIYVFSCKSLQHSIFKSKIFNNRFLLVAVLVGFLIQLSALYVPQLANIFNFSFLGPHEWLLVFSLAFMKLVLIEFTKYTYTSFKDKKSRIWNY